MAGKQEADIANFSSKLQFRKFVLTKSNDSESECETIKAMSGIDIYYHYYGETYTERQLGEVRVKGFNGQSAVVTVENCLIKTYNLAKELKDFNQFQHIWGRYETYFYQQHLNLLCGEISCDGTFHCFKAIMV